MEIVQICHDLMASNYNNAISSLIFVIIVRTSPPPFSKWLLCPCSLVKGALLALRYFLVAESLLKVMKNAFLFSRYVTFCLDFLAG